MAAERIDNEKEKKPDEQPAAKDPAAIKGQKSGRKIEAQEGIDYVFKKNKELYKRLA